MLGARFAPREREAAPCRRERVGKGWNMPSCVKGRPPAKIACCRDYAMVCKGARARLPGWRSHYIFKAKQPLSLWKGARKRLFELRARRPHVETPTNEGGRCSTTSPLPGLLACLHSQTSPVSCSSSQPQRVPRKNNCRFSVLIIGLFPCAPWLRRAELYPVLWIEEVRHRIEATPLSLPARRRCILS
jgi:hypothetical protein